MTRRQWGMTQPLSLSHAGFAAARRRGIACAILGMMAVPLFLAASGSPQTTRMTIDDFDAMTAAMAGSLLSSEALAARTADSDPWIVSIQKVMNLSNDVMPQREQWSIMAQIRGASSIETLWHEKNVRFVLPAERVMAMRGSAAEFDDGFGKQREPTHAMTATFRSITRAQERDRTDVYYTEFEIIDLRTGVPVWQDRFEFKRAARGHLWD